ncbi:hypothetical protein PR202_gb13324 [Eleusine coracana subsp. coracana]|uniref:Uncharacterized protein n=1 Tax=Eleusine coracana subsp. coracana TaxID=191504 RepID=A0AAV5ES58_ELECO|nr:hypothetical protein PR202_gb13324 [Eleusine coracana subsp. coracana]
MSASVAPLMTLGAGQRHHLRRCGSQPPRTLSGYEEKAVSAWRRALSGYEEKGPAGDSGCLRPVAGGSRLVAAGERPESFSFWNLGTLGAKR